VVNLPGVLQKGYLMYTAVLAVHIILAVILIGLVLLQQGKGADVGAVMGGGANTLFGVGGASSLLVRATTGIAICFMLTSILLVKLSASDGVLMGGKVDVLEGLDQTGLVNPATAPEAALDAVKAPEAQKVPEAPKPADGAAPVPVQ
jgi:preprotein translocase subunit SecG